MGDWLYLIIGIAVVGVLTLVGLVTSGRRRKGVPPAGGASVGACGGAMTSVPPPGGRPLRRRPDVTSPTSVSTPTTAMPMIR